MNYNARQKYKMWFYGNDPLQTSYKKKDLKDENEIHLTNEQIFASFFFLTLDSDFFFFIS